MVMSAGTSAAPGGRAAAEAIQTMRDRGLDLAAAREPADLGADRAVRRRDPDDDHAATATRSSASGPKPSRGCTSLAGGDISDPIGGPLDLYRRCAEQLDASVAEWVEKLPLEAAAASTGDVPAAKRGKKS